VISLNLEFGKLPFLGLQLLLTAAIISLLIASYGLFNAHAAEIVVKDTNLKIETVVSELENPTSMAFLDSNKILVLEKDSGKVQRIVNDVISTNPDLTINVNHLNERGLLGMAIQSEQEGDNGNKESGDPKYLYLFYTEPRYDNDSSLGRNVNTSVNCNKQECNENQFNNRLYRYEYKNNKWVNPKLLVDIPIYWNNRVYPEVYSAIINGETDWAQYRHSEGTHQGGKLVLDNNNNIFLVTGDGGTCRNYDSCYRSLKNGFLSGKTANKVGGFDPAGMGGILHVTNEGEPVNNGGIIADGIPGEYYYAYGIRNSFGIDIDPVTGDLWDTESGPEFGDEINLVKPGFNSGWTKIQGIWPIWNYTNLMRSDEIGYHYPSNVSSDQKLEDFDGRGHYSDPEFAWNDSKGVTSIRFLDTDKLGKEYENDILVGDANGTVYHFELNENRSGLKLAGSLSDKIANNDLEVADSIFVGGLDTITDIQVGPDGYVYILSYSGKIYKVSPKDT
jgi:glucose/arabinose dehydrogenase